MSGLKRRLSLPEAMGLSLSIVAPTLTAAFNISLVVGKAGAAAPTAFAIGTVLVGLVAIAFVSFARRGSHAGSAYAYIAGVFGPRAGFIAGWTLLLTYLAFATAMTALVADFLMSLLSSFGLKTGPLWILVALISLSLATWLAYRDVKLAGRLMLLLELASLIAIVILCVVILGRAPGLPTASLRPSPQAGGWSGVAYALVFTVLSFAGFEGAATLGEETVSPRRNVPVAMIGTLIGAGAFFTFASYCEVRGFGAAHIGDLAKSTAPLNDLAERYTNRAFAAVLDIAAAFSAFSGVLGSLTASGRLLYALGRAGLGARLGKTHRVHGTPGTAVMLSGAVAAGAFVIWGPMSGAASYYANVSTVAVLALILVYLGVIAAQCRIDVQGRRWLWPALTAMGGAMLVWCLANTVYPVPAWPDNLWPYLVLVWLGGGLLLLLARPALAFAAASEGGDLGTDPVEAAVKAGIVPAEV
jgi:amino acid transporter